MSKWVSDTDGAYAPFFKNLEVMRLTHLKKNADYAGDGGTYFNFEYAAEMAKHFHDPVDKVFVTMLGIKLARLSVLKRPGKKPNHESVLDSQKDLATYSAIWWTYQCEQEAKRVKRGRVRTGGRKRVSKTSRRRGLPTKNGPGKPEALDRTARQDPRGIIVLARKVKGRTVRNPRLPVEDPR